MNQCPKCRAWLFQSDRKPHICPPVFVVHHEDHHGDDIDDGAEVHAHAAEFAATDWIEKHCDCEARIDLMNSADGWLVSVREKLTGKVWKIRIHAEASIDYSSDVEFDPEEE